MNITTLTAKEADVISAIDMSPTVGELFTACMASIWTTSISGSTSIAQSFESSFLYENEGDLRLRVVAKRLRRLGYKVELGAGCFIDIDWTNPRKARLS